MTSAEESVDLSDVGVIESQQFIKKNEINIQASLKDLVTRDRGLKHERLGKFSVETLLFLICLFALWFISEFFNFYNGYHLIAFMLIILIMTWTICFLFVIFSMKHLHFIRIKRKCIDTYLYIPYDFEENIHMPMKSVSGLSALRGSNIEKLLGNLMQLTFGLILSVVLIKYNESHVNLTLKNKIELILLVISSYGCFLISTWNLEESKYNLSIIMHYLATSLSIFLGPLSLCIYKNWDLISVIIMSFTYTIFFIFFIFVFRVKDYYQDINFTHKISIILIIIEVICLIAAYSSLILFVYFLGN